MPGLQLSATHILTNQSHFIQMYAFHYNSVQRQIQAYNRIFSDMSTRLGYRPALAGANFTCHVREGKIWPNTSRHFVRFHIVFLANQRRVQTWHCCGTAV